MSHRLRRIAEPFVVGPPAGARVRTRLRVSDADATALAEVGAHLGSLAGADLARRCAERRLGADGRKVSRQARKRALTAASSSRWAGAITRTTNDAWGLAERNLLAGRVSLRARARMIHRRLAAPVAGRDGRTRGYATRVERWEKQQRLQRLEARLAVVDARLDEGRLSIVRGGRRLARSRHNLEAAGMDQTAWRQRWEAERWFICADGEADKRWGNETIRWHPDEGWVEIKLPAPLAHLANRPHGRYRLSCPVVFAHRGGEVAAQASSAAVRYDITYDPGRGRWYLDASWKTGSGGTPSLPVLRCHPVLAVDVNAGHLACWVINPATRPARRSPSALTCRAWRHPPVMGGCGQRSPSCWASPPSTAARRSSSRTSISDKSGPKAANAQDAAPATGGGAGRSAGLSPASPRGSSGTGSPRWPPTAG